MTSSSLHRTRTLATLVLGLFAAAAARAQQAAPAAHPVSDEDMSKLREEVRIHCALPPAKDAKDYPWYFHYELGLRLQDKQDWDKAADSLVLALDKRHEPSGHGRTYGMWFVPYRPYYYL